MIFIGIYYYGKHPCMGWRWMEVWRGESLHRYNKYKKVNPWITHRQCINIYTDTLSCYFSFLLSFFLFLCFFLKKKTSIIIHAHIWTWQGRTKYRYTQLNLEPRTIRLIHHPQSHTYWATKIMIAVFSFSFFFFISDHHPWSLTFPISPQYVRWPYCPSALRRPG